MGGHEPPLPTMIYYHFNMKKGDNNHEKWSLYYFCCDPYFLKVQRKLMGLFSFVRQGHESFLK